ncbi:ABC transporter substrate-binding protein [Halorussus salilacus]|uniref:ABC transporter substrate-binding protein n=1 Tax=Halorussus salilacus TaxID=2953750 RepID=UPI00209FFC71|nr:ABC transporter substrate-binding protein [Halorussus salilacus]USZ68142.1 ABC transporter substrate-binding protein [Halorussus salilacus]
MSENYRTTRRSVLRATTAAGVAGLVGVPTSAGAQDGPIQMGSILPITGELSAYGSGMQEAVNLAVQDVNDAGGPLDREIEINNTDSQTVPDQAIQQYQTLVNEDNIIGFVGAASSGVSVPLAQQVADDEVMQVSNASTTPVLANIGYNEDETVKYFARTAPNDAQQGIVMGQILNEDDYVGADTAAFLHVANPYGEGLAQNASDAFEGETTEMVAYDPQATDYTSTLDSVFAGDPDAVGFVGYPGNGRTILEQWSNGGYGGEWVLSEGLNSAEFLQELSDITAGMYVASPDPEQTDGADAFEEKIGDANTLFAPHAYDALFLMALAIEQGGEASATAIAENIRSVSRPEAGAMATETETATAEETPSGSVVTVGEFDRAKELIADGEDINYQGASSPVNLNENLEPLNQFAILQVQDDGSTESLETIPRSFFRGQLSGGNGGQETTTE